MNHCIRFYCITILLLLNAAAASAQRTPLWEVVNTTAIEYGRHGRCIAGEDPSSLVMTGLESAIDDEEATSPVGNVVRRSLDSGRTRSRLHVGHRYERWRDLAHPTRDLIVVVGDSIHHVGSFNNRNRHHGMFLVSRDGGATWARYSLDSNLTVGRVSMYDGMHGIMSYSRVGNRDNLRPDSLPGRILHTDDAWRTWREVSLPDGKSYASTVLALTPERWMIVTNGAIPYSAQIYVTSDAGASWERSSNTPEKVFDFSFVDSLNGWGCGVIGSGTTERNRMAKTTDGGMTWAIQYDQPVGRMFDHYHRTSFSDTLNGLAAGNGNILRTTDGGVTWAVERFPSILDSGRTFIRDLFMPRPNLAYTALNIGVLLRHTDRTTLQSPFFTRPDPPGPTDTFNVVVAWTPVAGAVRYRLQIGGQSLVHNVFDPTQFDRLMLDTVVGGVSVVLNRLQYNHGYYARARAIAASSEESDWFQASYLFYTRKSATQLEIPHITFPAAGAKTVRLPVRVVWSAIPDAETYELQISERNDFSTLVVDTVNLTARDLLVRELAVNRLYHARVRVRNGLTVGEWSSLGTPHSFETGVTTAVPGTIHESDRSLRAIPNPTMGAISIELKKQPLPGAALTVHDARGVEVRSFAVDARRMTLDLSTLAPGAYLLRLVDGEEIMSTSVTVVR